MGLTINSGGSDGDADGEEETDADGLWLAE
jgi:hypothetical protein